MGWKRKVAKRYTDPQIKVMLILQSRGVLFTSEHPIFPLSFKRGDLIIPDVYLIKSFTRVECDSELFHFKRKDIEKDKDKRLLEKHGIKTIRLDNYKIMLASGEDYVLKTLGIIS